jgi:hypothetical protein
MNKKTESSTQKEDKREFYSDFCVLDSVSCFYSSFIVPRSYFLFKLFRVEFV